MRAGRNGGAGNIYAPVHEVSGEDLVPPSNRLQLEVFGRDGGAGVLLEERARRGGTIPDIPAQLRRHAYEIVPATGWRGLERELLRFVGRTRGLDQISEGRGAARVNAEFAVCVLQGDDRTGRRSRGQRCEGDYGSCHDKKNSKKERRKTSSFQRHTPVRFSRASQAQRLFGLGGRGTGDKFEGRTFALRITEQAEVGVLAPGFLCAS